MACRHHRFLGRILVTADERFFRKALKKSPYTCRVRAI
jgi:hypothetical protein